MPSRPVRPRRIVTTFLLATTLLFFLVTVYQFPEVEDFIAYWSASRITILRGDPYDSQALYQLQLASGMGQEEPVQVWNPPWTPVLLLPLGMMPLLLARAMWATMSLVMLWVSGYWLHSIFWPNPSPMERRFAILIPGLFVHGWAALKIGQISPLVLFGIVGAMRFYRGRPALAGAMLVLATIKPQLCIGVLLLFGLRALVDRSVRFVTGAAGTLGGLLVVLTLLRPSWAADYMTVVASPLLVWQTPTLATVFRGLFPSAPIVAIFGGVATLLILLIARWVLRTGRWNAALAAGTLVTMLFTVFAWDFDQVILLIPIFHLFSEVRWRRGTTIVVGALLFIINATTFLMRVPTAPDAFFFFWVTPAFTLIYVTALLWSRMGEPSVHLRVEPDPGR